MTAAAVANRLTKQSCTPIKFVSKWCDIGRTTIGTGLWLG